jgi:hypothetical protein
LCIFFAEHPEILELNRHVRQRPYVGRR